MKIGLIAGQGDIPPLLVSRWKQNGITPVIVGLSGITDPSLLQNHIAAEFRIGQVGHMFDFFKQHGVQKLVMVGALKRPNFWTVIPDLTGLTILVKLIVRKRGDDSLLRLIRAEVEQHGFQVAGVHEYLPELLSPAGVLGSISPTTEDMKVIDFGFKAAKQHGADDKGQSVVVNADGFCGYETEAGTNALIKSCAAVQGGILVKTSKPQQDLALDMPTIGLSTVEHIVKAGLKGIAIESGKTIIMDRDKVIRMCNEHHLFLIGL